MTYEELEEAITKKLGKGGGFHSFCYWRHRLDGFFIDLYLNNTTSGLYEKEGTLSLYLLKMNGSDCELICKVLFLEDQYENPLNITPEEASLFNLEHGFDYPKELVNDL